MLITTTEYSKNLIPCIDDYFRYRMQKQGLKLPRTRMRPPRTHPGASPRLPKKAKNPAVPGETSAAPPGKGGFTRDLMRDLVSGELIAARIGARNAVLGATMPAETVSTGAGSAEASGTAPAATTFGITGRAALGLGAVGAGTLGLAYAISRARTNKKKKQLDTELQKVGALLEKQAFLGQLVGGTLKWTGKKLLGAGMKATGKGAAQAATQAAAKGATQAAANGATEVAKKSLVGRAGKFVGSVLAFEGASHVLGRVTEKSDAERQLEELQQSGIMPALATGAPEDSYGASASGFDSSASMAPPGSPFAGSPSMGFGAPTPPAFTGAPMPPQPYMPSANGMSHLMM